MHPYIQKLLNGEKVEWKTLGEVCHSIKTGLNPRQFFKLNTPDATNYYVTIRELQNHSIIFSDKTDKINDEALKLCNNRSNLEIGDILFSGTGTIGVVALISEEPKNWNIKEGVYAIKPKQDVISSKFLLYLFETETIRNDFLSKSAGGTVKSVPMKEMVKIQIPIPPLFVQQKIAEILDCFSELEAELEAELELRQKQYAYYRNHLLSPDENHLLNGQKVEWKALGEIFNLRNGYTPLKKNKEYWEKGEIPWFRIEDIRMNGRILNDSLQKVSKSAVKGGKLFPANSIILATSATIGEHALITIPYLSNQRFTNFSLKEKFFDKVNMKFYFYYFFKIDEWCQKNVKIGNFPSVNVKDLQKIQIPIPPIEEQNRIVEILNKFDTLTNSISQGLPKEITLRRKQYEYYREQLLMFND